MATIPGDASNQATQAPSDTLLDKYGGGLMDLAKFLFVPPTPQPAQGDNGLAKFLFGSPADIAKDGLPGPMERKALVQPGPVSSWILGSHPMRGEIIKAEQGAQ
jgi:hypothetical protein